ncbi:SusC/RagA family TonB-linked outer membrane protein [Parapedobacter deserti]|uniref:SusC/RagA family TonB-linked outer membrane protein n=1 Tax=Parapedobacter deserti TaxID=1912957 RepID=A0ABV7JNH3_9SPHI
MAKQIYYLLMSCLLPAGMALAQQNQLRGTVSDTEGHPIPGVSISIKDSPNRGAASADDGSYSLMINNREVVVFRIVGYDTREIRYTGGSKMDVTLQLQQQDIDEVVVTALGIQREERSLGYSVTKVSGESISNVAPNNWLNGLAGKVPGLQMSSSGGGPGGSVRLVLRGQNSIDLSKGEALLVVDGVPVNSGMSGNGSNAYNPSGEPSIDYGNAASEINPDDIESVTVLRGPAAAALYGSRAGSGAIVITTKTGSKQAKINISVNSNAVFDRVLNWPDYQYEYGEGQRSYAAHTYYSYGASADGPNTRSTHTWGPKFEGQLFYQYDPVTQGQGTERTPWVADRNYVKGFYRTGATYTNTITLDGGNATNSFRASFTNLENEYIIPNTGFSRNTFSLASTHNLNKLNFRTNLNYMKRKSDNLPSAGYSARSISYSLMWSAPNIPIDWYRDYWKHGREDVEQNSFYNAGDDNPFMKIYEQLNTMDRDRIYGNVSATYSFTDKLSLMVRSGIDMGNNFRTTRRPYSSVSAVTGSYREQETYELEMNNDFLLRYDDDLADDWTLSLSAGGNAMNRLWKNNSALAERLNYPGLYTLANSMDRVFTNNLNYRKVVNSFYGLGQVGYKNLFFIDVTARNDWSSTLPPGNNSYFYPSVSASLIVTDLFDLSAIRPLSYLKVRASLAQVGNDTDPYLTAKYYSANAIGGSYSNPTVLPNIELKPEMITTREVGLDMRFFGNRLGLDVTYYNSDARDQIIQIPTDPSTGFSQRAFNAGLVNNYGLEIGVTASPFKRSDGLNWTVNAIWSANRNRVLELSDGVESIILSRGPRGFVQASVGGTLGDIYGGGLLRNEEGQVIFDAQGYPMLDPELRYQGTAVPKWQASLNNSFSYKNISVSFLLDGRLGGKMYSLTHSMLAYSGKLTKTLPGRYNGLIGEGVQLNPDGTYRPNDVVTEEISLYYDRLYQRDNVEMNTFDTSFLKLREAQLRFSLPAKWTQQWGWLQNASIGVFGRDLFMITKFPAFDPEVATLNNGIIEPGFETGQLPSTRSFGANLKVSF